MPLPRFLRIAPERSISIKNKRVWIIGASTGIGAALAMRCARDGARVAISARRRSKLDAVLSGLPGEGHLVLPLDVSDAPSIARAFATLMEQWGGVDIVIFNAGVYSRAGTTPYHAPTQLEMLDINLGGILRVLHHLIPYYRAHPGGLLMLTGSFTALSGSFDTMAYGASKAGIAHLAQSLSLELKRDRVQVQLITPGFVDTPMTDGLSLRMPMRVSADRMAGAIRYRMGKPGVDEITCPALFVRGVMLLRWLLPRRWLLGLVGFFRAPDRG